MRFLIIPPSSSPYYLIPEQSDFMFLKFVTGTKLNIYMSYMNVHQTNRIFLQSERDDLLTQQLLRYQSVDE